jgi:phosphoglycerate dehydrogenase-like enzyme
MGKRQIGLMKPSAVLVNTSRGAIVDEAALLAALRSGRLAGAAVDVIEGEHAVEKRGSRMVSYARKHENLLITPHIGGASHESVEKTDMDVLTRYLAWARGK